MVTAAATLHVPADYATIQAAIGAASDGDAIRVSPGIYVENIDFRGKDVSLSSNDGPAVTVIDGGGVDAVVTLASGEGTGAVISGFTIQNGRAQFGLPSLGRGGGLAIRNSSPTIRRNIITGNEACSGAGLSVSFGSPLIEGNTIEGNRRAGCFSIDGGGGIFVLGQSNPVISNNVISNNQMDGWGYGGGIGMNGAGTPTIIGNTIAGNVAVSDTSCGRGGGISMINSSQPVIVQNLIYDNVAGCGGALYWLGPPSGPILINNTVAYNSSRFYGSSLLIEGGNFQGPGPGAALLVNNLIVAAGSLPAIYCERSVGSALRFNNVFNDSGPGYGGACLDQTGLQGNISADARFVDGFGRDLHLRWGSPSVDAGDNSAPHLRTTDFDGKPRILDGDADTSPVVDLGAYEFDRDADSDTVLTPDDVCPNVAGPVSNAGCPISPPLAVGGIAGLLPADAEQPQATAEAAPDRVPVAAMAVAVGALAGAAFWARRRVR